jgi:hypothetical protein
MIGGIVVSTDTYMFRPIISKIDYLDELTREELENKLKQLFEHAPKEFIEDVIESIYDKTYGSYDTDDELDTSDSEEITDEHDY